MRQVFVLLCCMVAVWCVVGCGRPGSADVGGLGADDAHAAAGGTTTQATEASEFPESLAGTWRADAHSWELTIKADGSMSRIKHLYDVEILASEGGAFQQGQDGATAHYLLGPCSTHYDPRTRQLTATIVLDYFRFESPIGFVDGNQTDRFSGVVSPDGTTWTVDWTSRAELTEAQPPDANDFVTHRLVFTRIPND